jgi:RNA polymerase sigma-70 factor (ECF subfamily)
MGSVAVAATPVPAIMPAVDLWPGPGAFADVLADARAGDEDAFATIWRWLHPPLLRWLGVVAPRGSDDVASEVWISVVRGLDVFQGDGRGFRAWLFKLARRRAVDWGRHARRQPVTTSFDDLRTDVAAGHDDDDDVEAAVELLRGLTREQGEVLALRVIVGLSVSETANVVARSEGAVRLLSHRGLRTLGRQLEAAGREPVTH